MNILAIGDRNNILKLLNQSIFKTPNHIFHTYENDKLSQLLEDKNLSWDWIIFQGNKIPEHWKSNLKTLYADTSDKPNTTTSPLKNVKLKTTLQQSHKKQNNNKLIADHYSIQNLNDKNTDQSDFSNEEANTLSPIIFEYHAPCR